MGGKKEKKKKKRDEFIYRFKVEDIYLIISGMVFYPFLALRVSEINYLKTPLRWLKSSA